MPSTISLQHSAVLLITVSYLAINGMGTLNILEGIRECNPNIHRLVYACTEAIYWELTEKGRLFNELITEDMVAKYHHMPYFLTKWDWR